MGTEALRRAQGARAVERPTVATAAAIAGGMMLLPSMVTFELFGVMDAASALLLGMTFLVITLYPGFVLTHAAFWLSSLLIILAILTTVVVDAFNSIDWRLTVRSAGTLLIFWSNFVSISFLMLMAGEQKKWIVLGYCVGGLGASLAFYGMPEDVNAWVFGYGGPLTLLAALLLQGFMRSFILEWCVFVALGVLHGAYLSRTLMAMSLAIPLLRTTQLMMAAIFRGRRGWLRAVSAAATVLACVVAVFVVYQYMAREGYLGEDARGKFHLQSGGSLGVLIGGRMEPVAIWPLVLDRPLAGYGSAGPPSEARAGYMELWRLGYDIDLDQIDREWDNVYSAHSHIFDWWIRSGIAGALLWLFLFALVQWSILRKLAEGRGIGALELFSWMSVSWHIVFSPGPARLSLALAMAIVLFWQFDPPRPYKGPRPWPRSTSHHREGRAPIGTESRQGTQRFVSSIRHEKHSSSEQ